MRYFMLLLLLTSASLAQPVTTEGLGGIILHTSFANDRGQMVSSVEYKGVKYKPREAADALLSKLGWEKVENRKQLAEAWVYQVSLYEDTVLKKAPDEFKKKNLSFEPPRTIVHDHGGVEVVVWVREPVGMLPVSDFSHRSYSFSRAGKLTVKTLKRHAISFE